MTMTICNACEALSLGYWKTKHRATTAGFLASLDRRFAPARNRLYELYRDK